MPGITPGESRDVQNALTRLDTVTDRLEGVYANLASVIEELTGRRPVPIQPEKEQDDGE